MDRLIYTALTGLQRAAEAQAVTANNLANAQVPGFRREMASLSHAWLTPNGPALSARVQAGGESPHDLLAPGRTEVTGGRLDIAPDGGAWLAVVGSDGTESLSRRGDLRVDPEGRLVDGSGRQLLGVEGPIRVGAGFADLEITRAGELRTRVSAEAPFVAVAQLRLVAPAPDALARQPDGLFKTREPLPQAPGATVTAGALDRANVETAAALVELVQQSRAFELQTRLISTARELDEGSAALMRVE